MSKQRHFNELARVQIVDAVVDRVYPNFWSEFQLKPRWFVHSYASHFALKPTASHWFTVDVSVTDDGPVAIRLVSFRRLDVYDVTELVKLADKPYSVSCVFWCHIESIQVCSCASSVTQACSFVTTSRP